MDDSETWASQIINEILEECATEKMIDDYFIELLPEQDCFNKFIENDISFSKNISSADSQMKDESCRDKERNIKRKYQVNKSFCKNHLSKDNSPNMADDLNTAHSEPFISQQDYFPPCEKQTGDSFEKHRCNNNETVNANDLSKPGITLASICSKTIEEGNLSSQSNFSETICNSQPLKNLKKGAGNGKGVQKTERKQTIRIKKCKSIFSNNLENVVVNASSTKHTLKQDENLMNENVKPTQDSLKNTAAEKLDECHLLFKEIKTLEYDNLSVSSDDETGLASNLVMVEIYRKIVNFFEICFVSPIASILESHLAILEFFLALAVCTICMYFTDIKSKLKSSKTKKKILSKNIGLAINNDVGTEASNTRAITSKSGESLIAFSTDSNSNEDESDYLDSDQNFNAPFDKTLMNNLEEDCNYVKRELEDSIPLQEKDGPMLIDCPIIEIDTPNLKEDYKYVMKELEEKQGPMLIDCPTIETDTPDLEENYKYFVKELEDAIPSKEKQGHMFIDCPIIEIDIPDCNFKNEIISPDIPMSFPEYLNEMSVRDSNDKPCLEASEILKVNTEDGKFGTKCYSNGRQVINNDTPAQVTIRHMESEAIAPYVIDTCITEDIEMANETESKSPYKSCKPYFNEISDLGLNGKPLHKSSLILGDENGNMPFKLEEDKENLEITKEHDHDIFSRDNEIRLENFYKGNNYFMSEISNMDIIDIFNEDENQSKLYAQINNEYLKIINALKIRQMILDQQSSALQCDTANTPIEFNNNSNFVYECYETPEKNEKDEIALDQPSFEAISSSHIIKSDQKESDNIIDLDPENCVWFPPNISCKEDHEEDISIDTSSEKFSEQFDATPCDIQVPDCIENKKPIPEDISNNVTYDSELQTVNITKIQKPIESSEDNFIHPQYKVENGFDTGRVVLIDESTPEEDSGGCLEENFMFCPDCEHNEYQSSVTHCTQKIEFDEMDASNLKSDQTHSSTLQSLITEEVMTVTEEICHEVSSYDIHSTQSDELYETESHEVFYRRYQLSIHSESVEDIENSMDVSLEVNGSFQSLQSLDTYENLQGDSPEHRMEVKQSDARLVSNNKRVHFSHELSEAIPSDLQLIGRVESKCSAILQNNKDLDSSNPNNIEPEVKRHANVDFEKAISFQNLPDFFSPITRTDLKDYSDEEFQCVPSFASEPFEVENPYDSKNAIATFVSEVNKDRRKHKKRRNSLKSKVSSVFNSMKKLHGRFVNTSIDPGSSRYKKHKDEKEHSL